MRNGVRSSKIFLKILLTKPVSTDVGECYIHLANYFISLGLSVEKTLIFFFLYTTSDIWWLTV